SSRLRATQGLYCITEVRLITFKSAILARLVRSSSCTPLAKTAFAFSSLRFSKGKTAMLFSGITDVETVDLLEMTMKPVTMAASKSNVVANAAQRAEVRYFSRARNYL